MLLLIQRYGVQPHGVSWISRLPKQNQTNIDFNDEFYRDRLRALQAVDEIVDGVISRLTEHGILDETYIFYSTDNGYHIGQHRLQPGKECGFEEDVHIPLIVRGPGVPKGQVRDIVTSHTDLAPTFLSLAGGDIRADFDGVAIPLGHTSQSENSKDEFEEPRGEHVNIEYWGFALAEGKFGAGMYWNNTYKGLRLIGKDYNFYYSVWCSGEHELYDLTVCFLKAPPRLNRRSLTLQTERSLRNTQSLQDEPLFRLRIPLDPSLYRSKQRPMSTCSDSHVDGEDNEIVPSHRPP